LSNDKNQYAPMPGIFSLRERLAKKVYELYNTEYCPDSEITITPGATHAIYCAISTIIHEGDEAIIIDPAYDSYAPSVELNGGVPVHVALGEDFLMDWEQVKSRISSKTRLIIINNPHNPCGTTLSESDIKTLEKITEETDIFVLSDEVYEHIVFDGKKHSSVLAYPGLMKRCFAIFSFGKVFHITGWKLGYCIAPKKLTNEFRKIYQFTAFSSNTPCQYAISDFLESKEEYENLNAFFIKKRNRFINGLKTSRFKIRPCQGTYFQLLNFKDISDTKDYDFAMHLIKNYGIASIPISVFYKDARDHKFLRFCFAKSDEVLDKATDILCKI
jgi:methionine aminotransferase